MLITANYPTKCYYKRTKTLKQQQSQRDPLPNFKVYRLIDSVKEKCVLQLLFLARNVSERNEGVWRSS